MGLFGRRRLAAENYGWIHGDGWRLLRQRIENAIENDGFLFIIIAGERGKGKSSLALNIAQHVYGSRDLVLKSLVFTLDDYEYVVEKREELKASDGRTKLVLWDDIGVHFSTFKWFTPLQRQKMIDFLEGFQSVREDVAVLLATVVEIEMLPPKMRAASNLVIDCVRRGRAKVFTYSRYMWFRKWKVIGEVEWGPAEPSLYNEYREMKRRAHRARRKARIISHSKLVKAYAEVVASLYANGELDFETMYGMGLVTKDGDLTSFGYLVLRKAGLEPEQVLEVVEQ